MGLWRASSSLFAQLTRKVATNSAPPFVLSHFHGLTSRPTSQVFIFRHFSASLSPASALYLEDFASHKPYDFNLNYELAPRDDLDPGKIPVRAYFVCTSIDLKRMQVENTSNIVPPTHRSSNYIALRYYDFPSDVTGIGMQKIASCCRIMVVSQYGSVVLFNIEEHDAEPYLKLVRRYASGLLQETRKDDYAIMEDPLLPKDMQGGPDFIALKNLDTDSIRIIGTVLGQSIALDYFVSQIDGMVEEFTDINRGMEKTGTFTMDRKKLFQIVGKANSTLADVILKVGLFERSEIAWRDAKYAQIYEYLREEFEVTQRFATLDFKLKFVEHNIHFLQEVIQNRKSNFLEWCIIFLLTIENCISLYEIVHESGAV